MTCERCEALRGRLLEAKLREQLRAWHSPGSPSASDCLEAIEAILDEVSGEQIHLTIGRN